VLARRLRLDNRQIVVLIVLNLVISFAVPGIACRAHVGGLVAEPRLPPPMPTRATPAAGSAAPQGGATVAIIVLLAVAVLVGIISCGRRARVIRPARDAAQRFLTSLATGEQRLAPLRGECDASDDEPEPEHQVQLPIALCTGMLPLVT